MRVAFVSCVKTKADRPMSARDLYTSPWFKLARSYAERHADAWFVLSAKYGLVPPDQVIAPYEMTLNRMGQAARREWRSLVEHQLGENNVRGERAIILAGMNYRTHLYTYMMGNFREMEIPMAGLMMGQQLGWLSRNQ